MRMDGTTPPSDFPPTGPGSAIVTPVDGHGFDLVHVLAGGGLPEWLEVTLVVGFILAVAVLTGAVFLLATRKHQTRRQYAVRGGAAFIALIVACLSLSFAVPQTPVSTHHDAKAFTSWAHTRYGIDISQSGFEALAAGHTTAVDYMGAHVEVHAVAAQNKLTYLFGAGGYELAMVDGGPQSGGDEPPAPAVPSEPSAPVAPAVPSEPVQ